MEYGLDKLGQERPPSRLGLGSLAWLAVLLCSVVLATGCSAGRGAYGRGHQAALTGDWDTAVENYRKAVQADPDRAEYRIAFERASLSASQAHLDQARLAEARMQFEEALREYRRASEFDPPNRQIAAKVTEIERRLRDQLEAAAPKNNLQQLKAEAARQSAPPPLFNLNTVLPSVRFNNASLREILNSIGQSSDVNVTYDNTFQDRMYSVQLNNVTLEEALTQILAANQLFYKVVSPRSILVVPDNVQKRGQYEEQAIRTFPVSHADATELAQTINTVIRVGGGQVQPMVVANKTSNTLTVRATTNVMAIIERIVDSNDNPRAEVLVDVQILEVNKARVQQFGLDLGDYTIGAVFSPEQDPRGTTVSTGGGTASAGTTLSPRPFNANTISRGINTTDFYLSVPSAAIRFLETDTETKVVAKPQLRGAEGQKLILNLGEEVPVPSTTFTPVAQGGAAFNPLTSFTYRPVGVNVEITPRVTAEDEVILELLIENSALGSGLSVAGQDLPSFLSRKVQTKLRLRDGESNLLAGLLQEQERKSLRGLPYILHLPIIKQLFSANDNQINQTDIVMLLTPRIVRTHELTARDLASIYIGTQQNLALTGPPAAFGQDQPPASQPGGASAPAGGVPAAPNPVAPTPLAPTPGAPSPGTAPTPTAPTPSPAPTPGAAGSSATPTAAGATGGLVALSVPNPELRVGGGPYTVPISITGASRLSSMSLTVTFNPTVLRLRTVQEGSFMRSGGVQAAFTSSQTDAGRIDIAVVRPNDATGVAGTGLLSALLFDAVGPGPANLTVTGTGSAPGGASLGLQFAPVTTVTVK
jgi:type II secretory pathway component GspD/PulD (secretin)